MKTLWILDHYASEPKYGGISRQYDFALELSRRGYKVTVISSSYSHFTKKYFSDEECKIEQINENVHFVYLHTAPEYKDNGINRLKNMVSYVRLVRRYRNYIASKCGKPDVVTGCSIHPFAWVAAYQTSKKYKTRFCVEVRDLWPHVFIQNGEKPRFDPMVLFFGALERWAYKKSDRIIYSMTYGDRYICDKLGFSREKAHWIGQPMDCERFDNYAKTKSELIPSDIRTFIKDSFTCVFAGYYMDYEGVYTMLEAAKMLKDNNMPVKMVFVGSGIEYEGMLEFKEKHKLENVLIGTRISKEAIPALLKECKICMAQLAHEGNRVYQYGTSKNKVNEYLYSGACTIFGFALKDDPVQISGAGYVIEPRNSEVLFEKIKEVYEMPGKEREKFGKNGIRYIDENHRVEILADKLEKILFE